jgi:nucleotide-binding universal stress UspA family protein
MRSFYPPLRDRGYRSLRASVRLARMRVLVGIDGSSNSLATVSFVGRLLSVEHDELILAYVAPPPPFSGEDVDPGVAARAQRALSNAVFDEAMVRLSDAWQPRTEKLELTGLAGPILLEAASEKRAAMIAVGFRGTGFFERLMLGSVSRAVVHTAHVPVLVVKTTGGPDSEKIAGTPDGTFRVLAAFDGSEFGNRICELAGKLTWPDSTRGWAVRVVPPMFVHQLPDWLKPVQRDPDVEAMADAWRREYEQQLEQAGDELKAFQQSLPAVFHQTEPLVAQGIPAEQILANIARHKIDMTIVGSRGHTVLERLLVGSTSARIINEAPCSVLIAR